MGAVVAGVTAIALLTPGGPFEDIWRLKPEARGDFASMGLLAAPTMVAVAGACGLAARGLWIRARWGHRLALSVLAVNLIGDAANAIVRGDPRTLIGLPIGGAMIAYLLSAGVRRQFNLGRPAS